MKAASSRLSRGKLVGFTLAALGLACGGAILLGEVGLRLWGPRRAHGTTLSHPTLHHAHVASSSLKFGIPGGEFEPILMHFDEDGARVPDSQTAKDEGEPFRLAILGDSFVEAAQVEWEISFVGRLAEDLEGKVAVRNFGVSSYSPLLSLLQWRQVVKRWRPTHVLYVSYDNDFGDAEDEFSDASYLKNAILNEAGEVQGVREEHGWVRRLADRSYLRWEVMKGWAALKTKMDRRGETKNGAVSDLIEIGPPSSENLLALRREVEKTGARFLHTAIPSKELQMRGEADPEVWAKSFAARLEGWSGEQGLTFLNLNSEFIEATGEGKKLFFEKDIHLNSEGHRVVFESLRSVLEDEFETFAGLRP
ncbi:MAG: hypothetical protein KDK99_17300 [Verrucomicrobiales bacterium]|nr:hypothetical protein [Verrucomicrobiales bacterium]